MADRQPPSRSRSRRLLDALAPYLVTAVVAAPLALVCLLALRGEEVHWRYHWAFIALSAVPLAAWIGFHLERRRAGTMRFSRTHDLQRTSQGLFGHLVHLPRALRLIAIALVAVALARPQRLTIDPAEVEGIDIVVALDVSNSMAETDLLPDRLTAAKRVIADFIRRRPHDRIGLVLFGREAMPYCPLTSDQHALTALLAEVRLGLIDGQGTAIGNALGTAINRLKEPVCDDKVGEELVRCSERKKQHAKSKVVVLVTDGDDNASKLDPRLATQLAQKLGIKVFTILIGRDTLAAEEEEAGRLSGLLRGRPRYPVNPKLLEEIAGKTGGMPYLATDDDALKRRFQAILEDLDRSRIKASQVAHYADLYPILITPAAGLLLIEILLSLTRFRRFP